MRKAFATWLDSDPIQNLILAVIVFNAIILGLETVPSAMETRQPVALARYRLPCHFRGGTAGKAVCTGPGFFRRGKYLDAVIAPPRWCPVRKPSRSCARCGSCGCFVIQMPRLRRVVEGFVTALPGMGSVFLLMGLIFYIGAVMATKLFASAFPQWFGDLGSAYSLFQIMTLESWSMGIVRLSWRFTYAWLFFVPFILLDNLAVNLGWFDREFDAEAHSAEEAAATDAYRDEVMMRLKAIEAKLAADHEGKP